MLKWVNVTLNTQDLPANRRFSVDCLHVEVVRERPGKHVALRGHLNLDAAHGNPPTTSAHVMLLADDLAAVKRRAAAFGYGVGDTPAGAVMTRDPDGRLVEIMPRDAWKR